MSTAWTYATLQTAVTTFAEDSGADFDTAFDLILPLAEDKVLRDLDLELFNMITTTAFGAGSAILTKPTGIIAPKTIHYTDASGNFVLLEPRSYAVCKDYWPKVGTTTATPKYYAELSDTEWFIAGTPASALVVTERYIKRPTAMSGSQTTSWLGTNVGDLLFYACLVCSEQWLKGDERIPMWKKDYDERLSAALLELKPEAQVDYMPMTAIPTKE